MPYVKKHPTPDVLYTALCSPTPEGGWEFMTDEQLVAWVSQEKQNGWMPQHVDTQAPPTRWRVSKDTIISRVTALGALPHVMIALAQQSAEQQFIWTHSAWFWSDNPNLRGLCAALGIDPDAVLAVDEYI